MRILLHVMAWGSFILILTAQGEARVILPAITLWVSAFLIGRGSRREPPEMRFTSEITVIEEEDHGRPPHGYDPGWGVSMNERIRRRAEIEKRNAGGDLKGVKINLEEYGMTCDCPDPNPESGIAMISTECPIHNWKLTPLG